MKSGHVTGAGIEANEAAIECADPQHAGAISANRPHARGPRSVIAGAQIHIDEVARRGLVATQAAIGTNPQLASSIRVQGEDAIGRERAWIAVAMMEVTRTARARVEHVQAFVRAGPDVA